MSQDPSAVGRPRPALAAGVCLVLLAVGVALAAAATSTPVPLELPLPPNLLPVLLVLLVPAYVFASRVTIDFEVRGNAHGVTLGQLPLALGVLLVPPEAHLAAAVAAAVLIALARRQQLLKALYNVGVAGFEVGVVAFAVSQAPAWTGDGPDLWLWLWLWIGLLAADLLGGLSLSAVWWLLRMPLTVQQVVEPLLLKTITSTTSTALAIITLSAAFAEPASIALVLVLATLLTVTYRNHRRLLMQQATTHDLYAFVRDLGPVDADTDAAQPVLEQVRLLLHAERLDLLTCRRDGRWERLEVGEDAPFSRTPSRAPVAPVTRTPALVERAGIASMSTPLFGTEGFIGLLTARGRLGDARDFDLGDVQLLEAVGGELATALERGHLLADLQLTATTDRLTGLPNLAETTRLLDEMLADGTCVALAALMVDSFREVNDTLGHGVGDALLLETAERLRRTHPAALIGRIGGGRFAVALAVAREEVSPQLFGLGLRALVEGEAQLGQVGTHVRLSVGVAQGPADGVDAGTLLRRAETAMSSARHVHGGPVAWAPAYEVEGQRRLAVVTALREAVSTGAIGLAFQPKVCVRSGRVTGIEALARWRYPALGQVSPAEFVPLAETSGAIGPLTSTVLRQAAAACRGWQRLAPGVGVSVNVSAQTVLDASFVSEVASVLASAGLAAELLTLELTEGVVVSDPLLARERLGELRALGTRIAVDDFGTGYSSLTYLKGLPVDEVKIDKGFVEGLGSDPADAAVVRAVVDIAHTFGLTVVAEGVETERHQAEILRLGVDEAQGYLHAMPLPAQSMDAWLRSRERSLN